MGDALSNTGVGWRANYWIAYKYGLDETIASAGAPHPAGPASGGVWDWVGDFWGGYNGNSSPSDCSNRNAPSPYVSAATNGDGVLFYPGNEIGCYYTANSVGKAVLTASPAVNTDCASNGYSVCNGISGPVASMRLETVRRGYEDYEYMYLLGKKRGRSAPLEIINSMGAAGMTEGATERHPGMRWTGRTSRALVRNGCRAGIGGVSRQLRRLHAGNWRAAKWAAQRPNRSRLHRSRTSTTVPARESGRTILIAMRQPGMSSHAARFWAEPLGARPRSTLRSEELPVPYAKFC